MTALDTTTWTPAELAIMDTLRGLLIDANSIEQGSHASQYNGTYGGIHDALVKAIQVTVVAHQPELVAQARTIGEALIEMAIDSGESISHIVSWVQRSGEALDLSYVSKQRAVFTTPSGETVEVSYNGETVTVATGLGHVQVTEQQSWVGDPTNITSASLTATVTASADFVLEPVGFRNANSGSFRFDFAEGDYATTWASVEFSSQV